MCGIAGFFGNESWEKRIKDMNSRMVHRGPDAQEYWHDDNGELTFGHVRLSILDLSEAGRQPMISHDQRYVMVFNGEIYNHFELKDRMIRENTCIKFRGHSDTEILLEYISIYGFKQALLDSVGMFAIALYDRDTREILLARDRMGEKPLYYGTVEGRFCFASDIGSISNISKDKLTLDRDALTLYFSYGYIPAPYSVYREIKKLHPGCLARIKYPYTNDCLLEEYYWDIRKIALEGVNSPFDGNFRDAVDELDGLLHKSVKRQMVADVPVGAFLSGGIDSSAVVSVMQDLSTNPVKTFTIGFNEGEYNEACFSKEIANHLGTDHTEWYITPQDALGVIPTIPFYYGEPFADSSQIPTCLVSRLAKRKVTVSLSGDGGDELFCGYNTYFFIPKLYNRVSKVPYAIRNVFAKAGVGIPDTGIKIFDSGKRLLNVESAEDLYAKSGNDYWARKLMSASTMPQYYYNQYESGFLVDSSEHNLMLMDMLMYHPDDILTKVDRAAMAVSLETRIPLLDKDIIEFAWSLPVSFNKNQTNGKQVLREVLYKYIPREMMDRPKTGFSVPVSKWLRGSELREWAEDMLSEERIKREGILNPSVVSQTWNRFLKTGEGETKVWYLLMFEEWLSKELIA